MKDSEKQYIHPTRVFNTEEDLARKWQAYKDSLIERYKRWENVQYVGRAGERRTDNPKLPITKKGFYRYCYETTGKHVHQYFENKDGYYDDFVGIVTHIKNEVEEDLATGGLLNYYNASLTARMNGYVDKQERTGSIIKIEGLPKEVEKDLDSE